MHSAFQDIRQQPTVSGQTRGLRDRLLKQKWPILSARQQPARGHRQGSVVKTGHLRDLKIVVAVKSIENTHRPKNLLVG